MKWYPLAHSAAVTMLCRALSTAVVVSEIRQWDCQNLALSFLLYIFKFPDSRCRPLVSLSDNLNPFQQYRGESISCVCGAGMAKSRWAGTPSYAKTTDLSGSIISSPVPEKKPTQYSLLQQMPTKTLHVIGDIAMVIVKFRPLWPHTQRYALHSLSRPTMTSGRLRKMYTRSRRRTSSGEVRRDSLNKFRPILGGIGIV